MAKIHPKTQSLFKNIFRTIAPPPKLTISGWADCFRKLSSESSAEAGQWRTDRAPYQREIMDAISDSTVEDVVIMSSAQVGKSEILNNVIGYHIDYDPAPIMLIQPTVDMAEGYSKDRLDPMFRDTPTLREKLGDPKARDKDKTILHKKFPGGHLTLAGANSPAGLASRPIRIVLLDEVDRFPISAKQEGDPVSLVRKRTTTFWNRKHVMVSTPTIKGASRIELEFSSTTMEEWMLPCPACGEHQALQWGRIKFEKDSSGEYVMLGMVCDQCGVISKEYEWKSGVGTWVAAQPNIKGKRGFHLNELASPWSTWDRIMSAFLEAKKNPQTLKTWINTSLGESWEEESDFDVSDILSKRRQYYNCEVPAETLVLTCAVDVQDNRLEYEVCGWGKGFETWGIKYGVIMGDPGQAYVWEQLDLVLFKDYTTADDRRLNIMCTCVDTGGHFTSEAYAYCRQREFQRVFAIKGQGGSGVPFVQRPKRRNDAGVYLFSIGVDVGKDTVMSRLKIENEGDGFCHYPFESKKGYDMAYFEGLTSEKRVTRYKKGRPSIEWIKVRSGARNEPFDLRNYNTAAITILNPDFDSIEQSRTSTIKTQAPSRRIRQAEIY